MKLFSGSLARLIDELARLPGIGPKSAQRLAFYLLNAPGEVAEKLANVIIEAKKDIRYCSLCANLTDAQICVICADPRRNKELLCVVEEPKDVLAMEKVRGYKGLYHVLHGAISLRDSIDSDHLTIKQLLTRLAGGQIKEIILATNPNLEGDATALYLVELIRPLGIKVTRLARGLPAGASIEYADEITLTRALEGRQEVT